MFWKYINEYKKDIINSLCDLITFKSVSQTSSISNYPFGEETAACLQYFLKLASSLGFKTKNLNNYCGYVEFGKGKELIGIIGHLDVVSATENSWNTRPFIPTLKDTKLYGRGTIDDKGPVISCLYAMLAVKNYCIENNITVNKRIRLIVGLDEEKNRNCIKYYKEHEEIPTLSFSPDGDFPCVYAEKGILSLNICEEFMQNNNIQIKEFICNNEINVVPKLASCILSITQKLNIQYVINYLKQIIKFYNYEIDIYKIDNKTIKLSSYGKNSHSAHPELGINALSRLLLIVNQLFKRFKINNSLISTFSTYIGDNYLGNYLNINFSDESGILTLVPSQAFIKNNHLNINLNIRVPVNTPINTIIDSFKKHFSKSKINILFKADALKYDKNNYLVKTLCDTFNNVYNTNYEPIAIGGITYARYFDNCIAFGMNFPDDEDMCHKSNEFVDINKLLLSTSIYCNAIYQLLINKIPENT